MARAYRAAGGDSVVPSFGSTGELAAQIANGAPADLFFAANEQAIDDLAARGRLAGGTRRVYAVGHLALVGRCRGAGAGGAGKPAAPPSCPALTLGDLVRPTVRSVAIANPAHAPYGAAARDALQRSGLWPRVQPKLVFAANVAQALQFVETGNADAGLVALSVVLGVPGRGYAVVPDSLHRPLRQAAAVVAGSRLPNEAARFLDYVSGPAGRRVLGRYGFTAPDEPRAAGLQADRSRAAGSRAAGSRAGRPAAR